MKSNKLHIVAETPKQRQVIKLLLDDSTELRVGDRPIFGAQVTINESIKQFIGCTVPAGTVIGWVDYIDARKFGCFTTDYHYVDASAYLHIHQNQLVLLRPITIVEIYEDMIKSNEILSFSQVSRAG